MTESPAMAEAPAAGEGASLGGAAHPPAGEGGDDAHEFGSPPGEVGVVPAAAASRNVPSPGEHGGMQNGAGGHARWGAVQARPRLESARFQQQFTT